MLCESRTNRLCYMYLCRPPGSFVFIMHGRRVVFLVIVDDFYAVTKTLAHMRMTVHMHVCLCRRICLRATQHSKDGMKVDFRRIHAHIHACFSNDISGAVHLSVERHILRASRLTWAVSHVLLWLLLT